MRIRGIQGGFDFLKSPAGFDIGESLFHFDSNDPYWKAFLIGVSNTLRVAIVGIVLTTSWHHDRCRALFRATDSCVGFAGPTLNCSATCRC